MARNPSREEIESRAYEIYLEQGREDGHDVEHWLLAEQQLNGTPESEPERDPRSVILPTTTPQPPQQRSATAGASSLGSSSSILSPRGKS